MLSCQLSASRCFTLSIVLIVSAMYSALHSFFHSCSSSGHLGRSPHIDTCKAHSPVTAATCHPFWPRPVPVLGLQTGHRRSLDLQESCIAPHRAR